MARLLDDFLALNVTKKAHKCFNHLQMAGLLSHFDDQDKKKKEDEDAEKKKINQISLPLVNEPACSLCS